MSSKFSYHDYRFLAALRATTGGLPLHFFALLRSALYLTPHFVPLSLCHFLTVLPQISSSGYIGRGIRFQVNVLKSGDEYPGVALMM